MEDTLQIQLININNIKPYKNNPRINDVAVDYVADSIRNFGFLVPIILDKDKLVIAGHTRLKAAKKLGIQEIPCIIANDLTEAQANALRLVDNKVAEFSIWDYEKLREELNAILTVDMSLYGFEGGLSELDVFIDDELSDFYDDKDFEYNVFGVTLKLPMKYRADFKRYTRQHSTKELSEELLRFIDENSIQEDGGVTAV